MVGWYCRLSSEAVQCHGEGFLVIQSQRLYFIVRQDCQLHSQLGRAIGWALQLPRFSGQLKLRSSSWAGLPVCFPASVGLNQAELPTGIPGHTGPPAQLCR